MSDSKIRTHLRMDKLTDEHAKFTVFIDGKNSGQLMTDPGAFYELAKKLRAKVTWAEEEEA